MSFQLCCKFILVIFTIYSSQKTYCIFGTFLNKSHYIIQDKYFCHIKTDDIPNKSIFQSKNPLQEI